MSSNSLESNASQGVICWVDKNVNESDNSPIKIHLYAITSNIETFTDVRDCYKYLTDPNNLRPTFLILSGSAAKENIEKMEYYTQIQRIYIYCRDVPTHKKWAAEHDRIKSVTKDFNDILTDMRLNPLQPLKESVQTTKIEKEDGNSQRRKEEPFSYSISDRFISAIDENFLHWQLIIEILSRLKPQQDPKTEFIEYLTEQNLINKNDEGILRKFKAEYRPEKSIEWFTRDCFLHRIFNKALRELNGITLYLMRFFICDLKRELIDTLQQTKQAMVKVYRGQRMTQNEIEILNRSKDKWISINTFMLASTDQQKALDVVIPSDNTEVILFEIDAFADSMKHQPYAAVGQKSDTRNQDEVLFMLGSIFHIKSFVMRGIGFKRICLEQCLEGEEPLKIFYENVDKEIERNPIDAFFYGDILRRMSRFHDAEYFFDNYHEMEPNDQRYHIYMAHLLFDQNQYDKSLQQYRTALDVFNKKEKKEQEMADTHFAIGLLHQKQNALGAARKSFDEAMTLYKKLHGGEDRTVAKCHDEIAKCYENEKIFDGALHSRICALTIWKKVLNKMDAELGHVYVSLGLNDVSLKGYETALNNFDTARRIYHSSLPLKHPRIAFLYMNEGIAHECLKEADKAKDAFKKALDIYKECSSKNEAEIKDLEARLKNL